MMNENHDACYAAFKSKDPRFDGHFFVGVTSTGIYCRPVCRARLPKSENCADFEKLAAMAKLCNHEFVELALRREKYVL